MAALHHKIALLVCFASLAAAQTSTQTPSCPALVPPENGNVDVVETTATYSCDPGFTLSGSEVRTCESGSWTGDEGRCDPTPSPTPTPANAMSSMAATQSPSMSMSAGAGTTMTAGGSTMTAMMESKDPATTHMGDGDGDGHGGENGEGDNDTHKGDDDEDGIYDEGLSRGQVALTILATLLILMTITAFGALLWWKHHGTSYVKCDVSHA